jgi:DNA end-binding protein Ku
MARTVWKGSLSFGLVNVPVGLYPATEDQAIHFHQFEEGTADRIRLRKVNERTGDEVAPGHIVKGYDLGNGESVIVEPDELDDVAPERSRTLEIGDFVDLADIDPIYYRSTYYLAPADDGALKAYRLLARAMEQSGRAGIAPLVLRGKEYLCVVRAHDGVLVLETLYFDDEIRSPEEMLTEVKGVDDAKALRSPRPSGRELEMAVQLVSSMTAEWDPSRYHDTYRQEVEQLIEAKRRGKAVVSSPAGEPTAPAVDLLSALEASVRNVGGAGRRGGGSHRGESKSSHRTPPSSGSASTGRSRRRPKAS